MIGKLKTKTTVLVQSGTAFGWMINPYNGCSHGCKYCYGMCQTHKDYVTWLNASPRKELIEKLKEDIIVLRKQDKICDIRDIFLGSITDSYQPLEAEHKQTQKVIETLIENELPFSILTKSALILRDIDLFKGYKWCRVGVTITSFDETLRKDLEPYTADYTKRIEVLTTLKENGVSTYLSAEPIMPTEASDPTAIASRLRDIVDLFDFGLYAYKGYYDYTPEIYKKYYKNDPYHVNVFSKVIDYCQQNKINYCNSSHSKPFFRRNKLSFQPYPLLKPSMRQIQRLLTEYS